MKNNEREMTQEARQNIAEAMNNTFGEMYKDYTPNNIYAAPGELCVSRLEYGILLRKAQRYDMLIAALFDSTRLDYANEIQVYDAEKILRIFEKDKYISREKQLLEEKESKRRESEE